MHSPIHESETNLLVNYLLRNDFCSLSHLSFDNTLDVEASIITTYTQESSHKINTSFLNQTVNGKFILKMCMSCIPQSIQGANIYNGSNNCLEFMEK